MVRLLLKSLRADLTCITRHGASLLVFLSGHVAQALQTMEHESQQQCYAPMLLPVYYVPWEGQIPQFSLPPSSSGSATASVTATASSETPLDDSSDCASRVAEPCPEDLEVQLESVTQYPKTWCELEDKLFVRAFPLPLLSTCYVESEDGQYRNWGQNSDVERLFSVVGWTWRYIAIARQATCNVTFLTPFGECLS